jgi:hypothetical protein
MTTHPLQKIHEMRRAPRHNATRGTQKQACKTSAETTTLAMLNIEPPEPKSSGSNADDPINLAHLLGMLHIVDLIC